MANNRGTNIFIAALFLLTLLMGYNYFARPFGSPADTVGSQEDLEPSAQEVQETNPQSIFALLSPHQKVVQMIAAPATVANTSGTSAAAAATPSAATETATSRQTNPTASGSAEAWIEKNNPGFITLFGDNIDRQAAEDAIGRYKSLARLWQQPLVSAVAVDHEGGNVQRLSGTGFTKLPSWQAFCRLDVVERDGLLQLSSQELNLVKVDLVFAPMLDVAANNPALGSRACSGEYETVLEHATEFTAAFNGRGITTVFKHFPGIGATTRDLHFSFDRIEVKQQDSQLYRVLLDTFQDSAVMVSHAGVINQFPNVPCSLSKQCVGELYAVFPEVITFTDALNMRSAAYSSTGPEKELLQVAEEAVLAGNSVLVFEKGMTEASLEELTEALTQRYLDSPEFRQAVDKSVMKIIEYKFSRNLTIQ